MAQLKTNAMRILEAHKIAYATLSYDPAYGTDGVSVAHSIGLPPESVFKTLVAGDTAGGIFVFILPVDRELDLRAAARAAGVKRIEMVHQDKLLPLTGYVKGGCSPIGMKKRYPTFLDTSARLLDRMVVSAGRIGFQVALAPSDLMEITGGDYAQLTQ